tara:strand:+ start:824 stop:1198 length:375 start_codon:yes stop_codon:yes gene_type:complete
MNTDKQPEGLGDTIEKFTKATGIKKLVEWAFGDDCGCKERKEKLNAMFPKRSKPECLEEKEYKYLKEIRLDYFHAHTVIDAAMQRNLLPIYNRVFKKRFEFSSCGSCVSQIVNELQKVLTAYEK